MLSASDAEKRIEREELCGKTLGDFEIVRRVGGGATSDVFLARQISLGRNVALKILKDELAADETYVKRFLHEARSAAKLEHPNVVRIYEAGEFVDEPTDVPFWYSKRKRRSLAKTYRYIAQEYVAGLSLAQFLRRRGSASIEQTFAVLEQIASALKRASDFRLIHRDVKPENVILDAGGIVHVVDFGLARPVESNDATWATSAMTQTGMALGTPLYMSPEQARGQRLDSRSDVYSLGVTAYHMLAGGAPFRGGTPLAVVLKHLNEKPRPIREARPDTPEALANLVERMIAKSPEKRPESPAALLAELRAAHAEYLRSLCGSGAADDESVLAPAPVSAATASTTAPARAGIDSDVGSGSDGTPPSFFQTEFERRDFERVVATTTRSLEWTTNCNRIAASQGRRERRWSPWRIVIVSAAGGAAFLLGGALLLIQNQRLSAAPPEPPLTLQRFNTVEEQYVFALQTSTIEAWKSVIEYFPQEGYWRIRAQRQLALAYVADKDVDSAEKVFKELAETTSHGVDVDPFPLAGLGWVAASRGNFDSAAAAVSQLQFYRATDRMTELMLGKIRELLQARRNGDSPEFRYGVADGPGFAPPGFVQPRFGGPIVGPTGGPTGGGFNGGSGPAWGGFNGGSGPNRGGFNAGFGPNVRGNGVNDARTSGGWGGSAQAALPNKEPVSGDASSANEAEASTTN